MTEKTSVVKSNLKIFLIAGVPIILLIISIVVIILITRKKHAKIK